VKVLFKEKRENTHKGKYASGNKSSKYSRIGKNERHQIREEERKI